MPLVTNKTPLILWQDLIRNAEERCSIKLKEELEAYLVTLLNRYINKPEVAKQIIATTFLEALNSNKSGRQVSLQHVGDQCLLFAGLFPRTAEKRHVKISYFVDIGRSAYSAVSHKANDLYDLLALQFVVLMDVLQSIREPDLLPIEAYDQWHEVGSQRAIKMLMQYAEHFPYKSGRH